MCVDCVGCLCHDLCIKSCCDVYEALNGRMIDSKAWNRGGKMLETQVAARDCPRADLGHWLCNYVINHVLIGMRLEMTMKFGFTK